MEVLDSTKQPLVRITSDTVIEQGSREFEVAIKREVVSVDLDDQPHDWQRRLPPFGGYDGGISRLPWVGTWGAKSANCKLRSSR